MIKEIVIERSKYSGFGIVRCKWGDICNSKVEMG